jgi:hypothetical protein
LSQQALMQAFSSTRHHLLGESARLPSTFALPTATPRTTGRVGSEESSASFDTGRCISFSSFVTSSSDVAADFGLLSGHHPDRFADVHFGSVEPFLECSPASPPHREFQASTSWATEEPSWPAKRRLGLERLDSQCVRLLEKGDFIIAVKKLQAGLRAVIENKDVKSLDAVWRT